MVEDGVLVLKSIDVVYHLIADPEHRATIERVHDVHAAHCPVARSLRDAIDITTCWELAAG